MVDNEDDAHVPAVRLGMRTQDRKGKQPTPPWWEFLYFFLLSTQLTQAQHSTLNNSQRLTINGQRSTVNGQWSTFNTQHSTLDLQCLTLNAQCLTLNTQCSTIDPQCSTPNAQPLMPNLNTQCSMLNIQSSNSQHSMLNVWHSNVQCHFVPMDLVHIPVLSGYSSSPHRCLLCSPSSPLPATGLLPNWHSTAHAGLSQSQLKSNVSNLNRNKSIF